MSDRTGVKIMTRRALHGLLVAPVGYTLQATVDGSPLGRVTGRRRRRLGGRAVDLDRELLCELLSLNLHGPARPFFRSEGDLFAALQTGLDCSFDPLFTRVDQGLSTDPANIDIDQCYVMDRTAEDPSRLTGFGSVLVPA